MRRPLEHIRVLDLTRVLAAPGATQNLAREGRETREAAYCLSVNRGKKSITVDPSKPAGQQLIGDLAARSDVLVENYNRLGSANVPNGRGFETSRPLAP